jgi:hypothetical protein
MLDGMLRILGIVDNWLLKLAEESTSELVNDILDNVDD